MDMVSAQQSRGSCERTTTAKWPAMKRIGVLLAAAVGVAIMLCVGKRWDRFGREVQIR